jgi:hypothetical protein
MHTYVSGEPRGSTFEVWLNLAHQVVNQYGQKPIWITEFGWSTYAGGVSQAQQAQYLGSAYSLAVASGVVGTFWFELRDASTGSGSDMGNYGVVTTGSPRSPPTPSSSASEPACTPASGPDAAARSTGCSGSVAPTAMRRPRR